MTTISITDKSGEISVMLEGKQVHVSFLIDYLRIVKMLKGTPKYKFTINGKEAAVSEVEKLLGI